MSNDWRPISGFEKYCINEFGEIRSAYSGLILKHQIDGKGYPMVFLYKDGVAKIKTVHRLIAQCFIPNPSNKPDINHKNGIKTDFRISNLEWCTKSENQRHAYSYGLVGDLNTPKGEDSHLSRLSESDVLTIRAIYSKGNIGMRPIARQFNVTRGAIQGIVKRITWKHI